MQLFVNMHCMQLLINMHCTQIAVKVCSCGMFYISPNTDTIAPISKLSNLFTNIVILLMRSRSNTERAFSGIIMPIERKNLKCFVTILKIICKANSFT